MKKIFILTILGLFLTSNAVLAVSINNLPTYFTINGLTFYKNNIDRINYSSPEGLTYVYMRDGGMTTIPSSYDEYAQIMQAFQATSYVEPNYNTYYPNSYNTNPYYQANNSNYRVYSTPRVIVINNRSYSRASINIPPPTQNISRPNSPCIGSGHPNMI